MAAQTNTTAFTKLDPILCHSKGINSHGIFKGNSPFDFALPLLLFQVALVLTMTTIVRFILRPLKQPTIISDIIGGILVGPSGLGRNRKFMETVFPAERLQVFHAGAAIGIVFFFFLTGLKQDSKVLVNSGKKEWVIAIAGTLVPMILTSSIFMVPIPSIHSTEVAVIITLVSSSLSITCFPSLHPIIMELNLLNSKLGRLALCVATNNHMATLTATVLFGGIQQGWNNHSVAIAFTLSFFVIIAISFCVVRPMMFWIIRHTPEGKMIDCGYIIAILIGVLVLGLISDLIGVTMGVGALVVGLAIPDGPPLGAALVESCETVVKFFLLPLVYASIGLKTDIFTIQRWDKWSAFYFIITLGHIGKLLGTMLASCYYKIPFNEALSLGLMMNFRGLIELIVFTNWSSLMIIDSEVYSILVVSTLFVTGISTPLVQRLCRDSKLYTPYGWRTIQHCKLKSELRILACIHTEENVPAMINLLEAFHPTKGSPVSVSVLNLMELVGRAAPMFIQHNLHRKSNSILPHIDQINNAFHNYGRRKGEQLTMQCFTTVSPYKTMHQDICMLALETKVSLIILPLHKERPFEGTMDIAAERSSRILNANILGDSPCTVGILVDHGSKHSLFLNHSWYNICVVFLGGADDREALSCGLHMARHPRVRLEVIRILSEDVNEDFKEERQMDEKLIALFKKRCLANDRVVYREVMVNDCEGMINVIRCLANEYDLMIVGRKQERNPILVDGMTEWCDNLELGVIGDFLASPDFSERLVSVLVLQQQISEGTTSYNGHRLHPQNLIRNKILRRLN